MNVLQQRKEVRKALLKTKSGSRSSWMDAEVWQRIFTLKSFGDSSINLQVFAKPLGKL